jgi:hypothetical protein
MAQKKQQSSYVVSLALKTAMQAKGIYPQLQTDMSVYDGAENDQHLCHGQWQDGSFRTLNIRQNNLYFDFIDPNDAGLVRVWTEREVYEQIGSYSGVSFSDATFAQNIWTHKITRNGVDYTGTDAERVNAMCKAFTALLNG